MEDPQSPTPVVSTSGSTSTNNGEEKSKTQQQKAASSSSSHPEIPASSTAVTSSSQLPPASLLTCSFNQDGGCLAIGTTTGFSVHNLHPQYSVSVERSLHGGIGYVEMLFRCNLMALVGGGPNPHGAPHRVLIWDDHIPKEIGELSFRQVVVQVKLRKDAIAVALRDRVYVYQLADLSLRDKIYTADNAHGLLTLSTHVSDMVLACPSVTPGHARVELYGVRKTVLIEAHDGPLRGLALTANGTKLATASTKGTIIRVFDVATATCLQEFRRGVERATITCLCWSWDYSWLACTSDKGTSHVFWVGIDQTNEDGTVTTTAATPSSSSSSKKSLVNGLFSSVKKTVVSSAGGGSEKKKSVCQIRGVPHPLACAFCSDAKNVLAVAGWDADGNGVLLLSEFAANQEARRVAYHVLTKSSILDLDGDGSHPPGGVGGGMDSGGMDDRAATGESEEERRRRRLRGWTPSVPKTPAEGRLLVGDRAETLEQGMAQIQFNEHVMRSHGDGGDDDDEEEGDDFVEIITPHAPIHPINAPEPMISSQPSLPVTEGDEGPGSTGVEGSVNADSVQTEPLDDDDDDDDDDGGDMDENFQENEDMDKAIGTMEDAPEEQLQ